MWVFIESKKIIKILLIIVIVLVIIDQLSKILICSFISEDVHLISDILVITKLENKGIAFGLNQQNLVNIFLTVVVLYLIIKYIINQKENLISRNIIFLGLILAGGISNLIDRIFKGAVFDFIKVGEFPVFNFADCFIVIRLDVICYRFFIFSKN